MARTLRLLLAAALAAGPAAAAARGGQESARDWTVTESVSPLTGAFAAIVDSPTSVSFLGAGGHAVGGFVGRAAVETVGRVAAWRGDVESHRPRVPRRHRPAPRGRDGDPPQ